MKLLLDENLPKRLKRELPMHEVTTTREMGWNGKKNGELLRLLLANGYEALLSFDRNIQHQQNFVKYPLPVLVLGAPGNDFDSLQPLVPKIIATLSSALKPGVTFIKETL